MKLFSRSFAYRLKQNFVTLRGIVILLLTLFAALMPLAAIPEQQNEQSPVAIGWVDNDKTEYSTELLAGVEGYPLLSIEQGDEQTLLHELTAGKLEAVFVVHNSFESSIKQGEYEDTLTMHKSAYSSVAGVISEGVVAKVMQIWLAEYSSSIAGQYGDDDAAADVFDGVMSYMDNPIMSIEREGVMQEHTAPKPLYEAAERSLFIAAALSCLFMLINAASLSGRKHFEQRLLSMNLSKESYNLAAGSADTVFLMPGCFAAVAAFCIASSPAKAAIMMIMYALYLLAIAGIGGLVCKIKSKTVQVMSISVISIANLAFGSLIIDMPTVGIVPKLSYILPSRWLTSLDLYGFYSVLGLVLCVAIYNVLPFIIRILQRQKRNYAKTTEN